MIEKIKVDHTFTKELHERNSAQYVLIKTQEELLELSLSIAQSFTKETFNDQKIYDEVGDIFIRLDLLLHSLDIDRVNERIVYKTAELRGWADSNTFKNI